MRKKRQSRTPNAPNNCFDDRSLSLQIKYVPQTDTVCVIEPNATFFREYSAKNMRLKRHYEIQVNQ